MSENKNHILILSLEAYIISFKSNIIFRHGHNYFDNMNTLLNNILNLYKQLQHKFDERMTNK